MRHYIFFILLICLPLLGTSVGAADNKAEAKKHFRVGLTLLEKQDFKAAAAEFELSTSLYENRNNLYNLANCYVALHRYGEALKLFEKLKTKYKSSLEKEMLDDINKQIKEINTIAGKLQIRVNLPGAKVKLDGKEVGTSHLPSPSIVGPGEHEIEVSLSGHDTVNQKISLVSGVEKTVDIVLKKSNATITIVSNESGAKVTINGTDMGTTPLSKPVSLKPGTYKIVLTKDGFTPMEMETTLGAGEKQSSTFNLKKDPQAVAADQEVSATPSPTVQPDTTPQAQPKKKRSKKSPIFWAGLASSIVFTGASGALWGMGLYKKNQYEEEASYVNNGNWDWNNPPIVEETQARQKALRLKEDTELLNTLAVAATATTGACIILTVVGAILKHPSEKRASMGSSALRISPHPGGVEVRF